jgi:predicted AAA+ superfamily ATPase
LIENLVYVVLRKQNRDVYYHKGKYECDFIVKDGMKVTGAIQVALSLKDENTRKRELRGLLEAMDAQALKEGLILTEKETETIEVDNKKIKVKPIYLWLEEVEKGG